MMKLRVPSPLLLHPIGWLLMVTVVTSWHVTSALSPRYRKVPLPARLVPTEILQALSMDASVNAAMSANGELPFVVISPNEKDDDNDVVPPSGSHGIQHGGPLSPELLNFPRHSHSGVNEILTETELLIRQMHTHSTTVDARQLAQDRRKQKSSSLGDMIFANTYVDLGKVDTVG
jgi:hypothetical protein